MNLLFEIPVYRLSANAWHKEVERDVDRGMLAYEREDPDASPQLVRERRGRIESQVTGSLPYTYNEVVGWIQLRWDGGQPAVKGYGWRLPQRRVVRGFHRKYVYVNKLLELGFFGESSPEIVATIRNALTSLTKRSEVFAGRHLDLDAFDFVAPKLDWRMLLGMPSEKASR